LQTFDNLRGTSDRGLKFRKNTILIFRFDLSEEEDALEFKTYENVNRAIEAYDELEKHFGDMCSIPDDHIDPRRWALFAARWVLGDSRKEKRHARTTA
jgi:hypothetical protein